MSTKYHEVTTWRDLRELAETCGVDERKPLRGVMVKRDLDGRIFEATVECQLLAAVTPQGHLRLKIIG